MKRIKLYSPDGKCEIECHPVRVETMLKMGWTETKPQDKQKKEVK